VWFWGQTARVLSLAGGRTPAPDVRSMEFINIGNAEH
jgi:hypothetical protein